MVKKVLILFFHPRFEDSHANKALVKAVQKMESVTFRDVYEYYPDFNIDIKTEQELLLAHDIIIWQHPFYWYSCPPLMKQWLDLVLEYGWAYGKNGDKLKGKAFLNAITSAGNFEIYQRGGKNQFTYRELLQPFEQTVNLCLANYLPPFIVPSSLRISDAELSDFSAFYTLIIEGLQNGGLSAEELMQHQYFNDLNPKEWKALFYKTQ